MSHLFLMNPQPPDGMEIECVASPYADRLHQKSWFNHAVEVGGGYEAEFFRCPLGIPDDAIKKLDEDGRWQWFWVFKIKPKRTEVSHAT